MPAETESKLEDVIEESDGTPLCLGCMEPNNPLAHFCAKCGAPMTSYSTTGPLEQVFAEGHAYRQAAERPRHWIVVLGIWMIFGASALGGGLLADYGLATNLVWTVLGTATSILSVVMIVKTTRSYFGAGKQTAGSDPADQTN